MTVKERFLQYVRIDTQSDPTTGTHPSTPKQFDLARLLKRQLEEIGASDVTLDEEHCYVYACIPANAAAAASIAFIAHVDTEPVCSGKDVKPRCIFYEGGDIRLNDNVAISEQDFPFLASCKGEELIVTDGTTLLGADDKAGVAEIMAAAEYLLSHPEIKHGKIGIAFTPDEEIGEGPAFFDVKKLGCDFAYTLDGGGAGDLGYETFNAAEAEITFRGVNIHPGAAKGKMKNCTLMASDFLKLLPEHEIPAETEGREGFYHVESVKAEIESGRVLLIIRDHDGQKFAERKRFIADCAARVAEKYGTECVSCRIKDQYRNCYEVIKEHFHLVENARQAMQEAGVTPREAPVRGGTDGCTLSFMGLPCPNLFTGGMNAHSVRECIPVSSMEKAVEVIINLVRLYAV